MMHTLMHRATENYELISSEMQASSQMVHLRGTSHSLCCRLHRLEHPKNKYKKCKYMIVSIHIKFDYLDT